jgi:hypothetical protein
MPGMELPGDFTVDRNPGVSPDLVADFTGPLAVPGAPFGGVLFERVPGMSLTPQAAGNAYIAVGRGGTLEVLTGPGGSPAGTIRVLETTFSNAGFSGVSGAPCVLMGAPGVRITGFK